MTRCPRRPSHPGFTDLEGPLLKSARLLRRESSSYLALPRYGSTAFAGVESPARPRGARVDDARGEHYRGELHSLVRGAPTRACAGATLAAGAARRGNGTARHGARRGGARNAISTMTASLRILHILTSDFGGDLRLGMIEDVEPAEILRAVSRRQLLRGGSSRKRFRGRLHVLGHKVIPQSGLSNGLRCASTSRERRTR